ncbi:hypothetical protein BJ508DRAFT_325800 [Ascobolus immersus RN42]|uniref:Uncharacterized protein n=1 Tax=Ascobolus immersus RN42 TaxID=1160509 RepID=A0A3N4I969_ASCIM|nr:hypothetical protein BJ508DRAFT_325800 [Ascobolus immersus RN42]
MIGRDLQLLQKLRLQSSLSPEVLEDFMEQRTEVLPEDNPLWQDEDKVTREMLRFAGIQEGPQAPESKRITKAQMTDHLFRLPFPSDIQIFQSPLDPVEAQACLVLLDNYRLDFLNSETKLNWMIAKDGGAKTIPNPSNINLRLNRKEMAALNIPLAYKKAHPYPTLLRYLVRIFADEVLDSDFAMLFEALDSMEADLNHLPPSTNTPPSMPSSPPSQTPSSIPRSFTVEYKAKYLCVTEKKDYRMMDGGRIGLWTTGVAPIYIMTPKEVDAVDIPQTYINSHPLPRLDYDHYHTAVEQEDELNHPEPAVASHSPKTQAQLPPSSPSPSMPNKDNTLASQMDTEMHDTEMDAIGTMANPIPISSADPSPRRFSLPPKPSVNLFQQSPKRRIQTIDKEILESPTKRNRICRRDSSDGHMEDLPPVDDETHLTFRGISRRISRQEYLLGRRLTDLEVSKLHRISSTEYAQLRYKPSSIPFSGTKDLDNIDAYLINLIQDHQCQRHDTSNEIREVRLYYNTIFSLAFDAVKSEDEMQEFTRIANRIISECKDEIDAIRMRNPTSLAYYRLVQLVRDLKKDGLIPLF